MKDTKNSDREQWFIDRIGKRVFRNDNGCNCDVCKNAIENGMIISDDFYNNESYRDVNIRYFDTKEEVNEWLKTL